MNNEPIEVIVRVLSENSDVEVSIDQLSSKSDVVEALIDAGMAKSRSDSDKMIEYDLIPKGRGQNIVEGTPISSQGVQNGDILLMSPIFRAGGRLEDNGVGLISIDMPGTLQLGNLSEVFISLDKSKFHKGEDVEGELFVELIEVGEMMGCELNERSIKSRLEIIPRSTKEQFFGSSNLIKWYFDLAPFGIGYSSLILKITSIKNIEGIGRSERDVFIFNKQIKVVIGHSFHENVKASRFTIDSVDDFFAVSDAKLRRIKAKVAEDRIGEALAELSNLTQRINLKIFDQILVLQSSYNNLVNRYNLNVLSDEKWSQERSRISMSTLHLVGSIERDDFRRVDEA